MRSLIVEVGVKVSGTKDRWGISKGQKEMKIIKFMERKDIYKILTNRDTILKKIYKK